MGSNALTLNDFLASNPADPSIVPPLVHVTAGENLLDILSSRNLDPARANLADDGKAVYLFVGKPAYKLGSKPDCDFWDAPVVFVFSKAAYRYASKIRAMDSGAFYSGRYSNLLQTRDIAHFEIDPKLEAVGALIKAFFGSGDAYLKGRARSVREMTAEFGLLPAAFRILALAALYSASRTKDLDDRKDTVEVMSTECIPVDKGLLDGIVLPSEWLADKRAVHDILKKMGCSIRSYDMFPIDRDHYTSEIYNLTRSIIREKHGADGAV